MPATVMYNNSAIAIVDNLATLQTSRTILPYDIIVTDISDSVLGVSEYIVKYIDRTIESIPSSIATPIITIGSQAFNYCYSLISVSFPNATKINNEAFGHCYSLTTVYMPNVSVIQMSAFYACSSLVNINFSKLEAIGLGAFADCIALPSAICPKITRINSRAFFNCKSLANISFPLATEIGDSAFYFCKFSEVDFPKVSMIGQYAFWNCKSLVIASFPSVNTIKSYAFNNCNSLTSLYLTGSTIATMNNSNVFNSTPMSNSSYLGYYGSIYVPSSLLAQYQTATNWSVFSSRFVGI